MKFDNKQFESGVKTTQESLDSLKKNLNFDASKKSLEGLNEAGKNFNLGNMGTTIEGVSAKFLALATIGITALTNITNKAISAGAAIAKSLTIDPIRTGLQEYETNLNSIQTILSNTKSKGSTLDDVNAALGELNTYSDKTIYNFSEMARNIGTFTAAGVELKPATAAIKGIANLAAVSGSSSQQAATAMYQLSQAMASGTVKLMDWNSVVNAGMGGEVFQNSLKETARAHGVSVDAMIKKNGSFRESLQEGWLTTEILTETLSKFTGDLSAEQLKSMGYTDEQIKGILEMGQTAQDAATKVKTATQLLDTLKEAAGSGWAQTWQLIFGDFEEARDLFTAASDTLGGFISRSAEARNKVLADWKEWGGRTAIIESIKNVFNGLLSVLKPIKDAFREIFPAVTGKQLADISKAIQSFTENLKIGGTTANNLKRTFAGFFAVLRIGWDVIKMFVKTLADVLGYSLEGSGGILTFTARIGDFLVKVSDAIHNGKGLGIVFGTIGAAAKKLVDVFKNVIKFIGGFFDNIDFGKAGDAFASLWGKIKPFSALTDGMGKSWSKLGDILGPLADKALNFGKNIQKAFSGFGDAFSGMFSGFSMDKILGAINTGSLVGLVVIINKIRKQFGDIDRSGGLVDSIKETFGAVTGTFDQMQNTLKATTLLQIAAALGIITMSVIGLSKVDSEGLTRSLTALSVMFVQLFASMAIFGKITDGKELAGLIRISAAMVVLSVAINILANAVQKLSGLSWEELAKGLTGVAVLMGVIIGTSKLMEANSKGLISAGLGMIVLAGAIKILVTAVQDLSSMSWEELTKGLVGVGAMLAGLGLFTKLTETSKGGLLQGAGLLLLAVGIKMLADAVTTISKISWEGIGKGLGVLYVGLGLMAAALILIPPSSLLSAAAIFVVAASLGMIGDAIASMGGLEWETIAKGLVSLGGALLIIAGALALLPPSTLLSAAAIFIVASSLGMIADALGQMGGMSWKKIAKGLVTLAGSLLIIGLAMYGMSAALPGAAALLVVAAALSVIAPVLLAFGKMTWGEIGKGLVMLAGALTIIGIAGALLTPVIPTLIGLGVAIALLGVGLLAAGVGLLAFSVALTTLSVAGTAATAAIVGIVSGLIGLIPMAMEQIGLGLIAFAKVIEGAGPAITGALTTVLIALLDAIVAITPKLGETLLVLVETLLRVLEQSVPRMVEAGLHILVGILNGIAKNIEQVVTAATSVIVKFLNGISANLPRIIQAGVNLIISFIEGITKAIRANSRRMNAAGIDLAKAIVEGMVSGITAGISSVVNAAKRMAENALKAAKNLLGINSPSKEFIKVGGYSSEGMAKGLEQYGYLAENAAEKVGSNTLDAMRKSIGDISQIIGNDVDMNPTITPVLDLSDIRKNAGTIDSALGAYKVGVSTYLKAQDAYASAQSRLNPPAAPAQETAPREFTFIQNNTSPKALSTAEVYRNTRNQLSIAKEILPI